MDHHITREWRETWEVSEFHRELQTETVIEGRNSREINLSAKGDYIHAIALRYDAGLTATAAETPIVGTEIIDLFLDDVRVRGPGKTEHMNLISSDVIRSVHNKFLDEEVNQTAAPTFGAPGAATVFVEVVIPVNLPLGRGYYTLVVDWARVTEVYLADVTIDAGATMQINIFSGKQKPTRGFAIESQTLNLAAAGRNNVTTVPQGWPISYIELLKFADVAAGINIRTGISDAVVDTMEWQLPNSETILTADFREQRSWHDLVVDYVREAGTVGLSLGYINKEGQEVPWNDSGVFTLETLAGVNNNVKTPDVWYLLMRELTAQDGERPPNAGGPSRAGPRAVTARQRAMRRRAQRAA